MIPLQRRPMLFTDAERDRLVGSLHSAWVADALFTNLPRDEWFLAIFDRVLRAEIERTE